MVEEIFQTTMDSRKELIKIINTIYHIAIVRHSIIQALCDSQWRKNLKTLSEKALIRKLRFIISLCPLQTIVYIYKRGILNNHKKSIYILAEHFKLRNLHNSPFAADIMRQYNISMRKSTDIY